MSRRIVTLVAMFTSVCVVTVASATQTVNDVTKLNPIAVEKVVSPHSAVEIAKLVRQHDGPVCIGGARHSQGGQIATKNCLFLDMRGMNRILDLDLKSRRIKVEAGATWRKIQEAIDP